MADDEKNFPACLSQMVPIRDALDVINGKWKLLIIVSLMFGYKRFKEIENSIPKITPKVLSKELKDLEQHQLVKRTVHDGYPVLIEYALTPYAATLNSLIKELHDWGSNHRNRIFGKQEA